MTEEGLREARKRLSGLSRRIAATEARRERLYEERRQVFAELIAADVPQAQVARMAGVTPMSVAFALGKSKKASETPGI